MCIAPGVQTFIKPEVESEKLHMDGGPIIVWLSANLPLLTPKIDVLSKGQYLSVICVTKMLQS